jgi:hypothetical protein
MNIHREISVAKSAVQQILDDLQLFLANDDDLKLDMIHGETPFFEVISALLGENENDEGLIEALEMQIGARKIRKERTEARIERRKAAISSLMDCAQTTKLTLPEATLSLRTLKPRPKVVDANALPDAFVKISQVRKPDTEAIAVAIDGGADIPGVVMTNGGSSLSVRRK